MKRGIEGDFSNTLIESSLDQELSVVRFGLSDGELPNYISLMVRLLTSAFRPFCLLPALWNMESIPLGSTEFCILPIELFRSIWVISLDLLRTYISET